MPLRARHAVVGPPGRTRNRARVSPVAVARARDLAERTGLEAAFVETDAQHLPNDLVDRFDVAFASYGVFAWISDLEAWMRSALQALRVNGRLVVIDLHPIYEMFESLDPLVLDFPYQGSKPHRFNEPGSYANPHAPTVANESIVFAWGLGELVTAAVRAGFQIDSLAEFTDESFDPRGDVSVRGEDGRYRLPLGDEFLPVTFALVATKHGTRCPGR
jgi:SAM-dependent methyltransferase